jgi:hypothetical protein
VFEVWLPTKLRCSLVWGWNCKLIELLSYLWVFEILHLVSMVIGLNWHLLTMTDTIFIIVLLGYISLSILLPHPLVCSGLLVH